MLTEHDLITRLERTESAESRGWFRWLHYHFLGRYDYHDSQLEGVLDELGLGDDVAQRFSGFTIEERSAFLLAIGHHAWSVGRLGLIHLADAVWTGLDQKNRGALLAGLSELTGNPRGLAFDDRLVVRTGERHSEAARDPDRLEWLRARLQGCLFSPESACQLACNAIRFQWPDVLATVIESEADLRATVHRGDNGLYPKTEWPELERLSHRVIDMILEAALIRRDEDAAILALRRGADPNIPVWRLERSYNEKHCALSFAISEGLPRVSDVLMQLGASSGGIDFTTENQPLFTAIAVGWDDFANRLLKQGATFSPSRERGNRRLFFGLFDDELDWARRSIGTIVDLRPIAQKQAYYRGNGQGGMWTTVLDLVVGDVERLKHYESKGLDTRLTAEELCHAIDYDAFDGLVYLLRNDPNRDRVLFRIRRRKPDFGAARREIDLQPQADGIGNAEGFDPAGQNPFLLPDGSKLYADLDAIAPPKHRHGPCLEGRFWLRVDEGDYRRRGCRVVMTKFRSRWEMTALPSNVHQIDDLLPCIKEVGGRRIRLGVSLGRLFFRVRNRTIQNRLSEWFKSPEFSAVCDEVSRRIHAQTETNSRPKSPVLSEDELTGYPAIFWPYLVRLPSRSIGMTPESCADDFGTLDLYEIWARQNKPEETFVPDPRLLTWEGWKDVPVEFQPFFEIDPIFDKPSVKFHGNNDYEKAMIHKAVMWSNERMSAQILQYLDEQKNAPGGEGT